MIMTKMNSSKILITKHLEIEFWIDHNLAIEYSIYSITKSM